LGTQGISPAKDIKEPNTVSRSVKSHRWITDNEANYIVWHELKGKLLQIFNKSPIKVLDLGGGAGDFSSILLRENTGNYLVNIDIDPGGLQIIPGINPVNGDILKLPFKPASFDGIVGRAILHHIPDALDKGATEIARVLKPGGMTVFQEPCNNNIFANVARKFFSTELHEEGEEPLDQRALLDSLSKRLILENVDYHFFLSYLMPHIVPRLKSMRRPLVALTRLLTSADKKLMKYRFFQKRAAYITVIASKHE
jgi:ubiquinone/menaquinone biosynthesis C-methylase UbiE